MSKFLAVSLMAVICGATAANAQAGCEAACAPACNAAQGTAQAPQATARAPQGTRSFSYQPGTTVPYGAMQQRSRGPSWGQRGAASKVLGNY